MFATLSHVFRIRFPTNLSVDCKMYVVDSCPAHEYGKKGLYSSRLLVLPVCVSVQIPT